MIEQCGADRMIITAGPEKLFKIQRVHFIICFVSNAVTFNFFVLYSQHGATADYVESVIYLKKSKEVAMAATKHERISDDFTHFMSEYLDYSAHFMREY